MLLTIDLRSAEILLLFIESVFLNWGVSMANWYPETAHSFGKEGISSRKVLALIKRDLVIFIFAVGAVCEKTAREKKKKSMSKIFFMFIVYLFLITLGDYILFKSLVVL